ncbi:MAG TPA: hypothetical protein VGN12_15500, partial [Pirellulales bacterium]
LLFYARAYPGESVDIQADAMGILGDEIRIHYERLIPRTDWVLCNHFLIAAWRRVAWDQIALGLILAARVSVSGASKDGIGTNGDNMDGEAKRKSLQTKHT